MSCAEGWFGSNEDDDVFLCYRLTDGTFAWSEANQACAALREDASLAEPRTTQMQYSLDNFLYTQEVSWSFSSVAVFKI